MHVQCWPLNLRKRLQKDPRPAFRNNRFNRCARTEPYNEKTALLFVFYLKKFNYWLLFVSTLVKLMIYFKVCWRGYLFEKTLRTLSWQVTYSSRSVWQHTVHLLLIYQSLLHVIKPTRRCHGGEELPSWDPECFLY